jgi:hypothetical protein
MSLSVLRSEQVPPSPPGTAEAKAQDLRWYRSLGERGWFAVTVAGMFLIFGLLYNRYWVPGGDSEVYVAIARNLVVGLGYMFNGQPVGMVPPGWSMALSWAMEISPEFGFLKLLTIGSMLGGLSIGYWICVRFAHPALCAGVILGVAMLSHVYSLTMWMHSDALFTLLTMASLLLALQVNEGRRPTWRIAALLALCFAIVFVRWAGVLNWLLLASALLRGRVLPRLERRWVVAGLCAIVVFGTYVSVRWSLKLTREEVTDQAEFGGAREMEGSQAEPILGGVKGADTEVAKTYRNLGYAGSGNPMARAVAYGNWLSYLWWQPLRLGAGWEAVWWLAAILGWIVFVPLLITAVTQAASKEWLFAAVLLYTCALAVLWPNPVARYLVPISPFIALGTLLGLLKIISWLTGRLRTAFSWATIAFVASVLVCNGMLWGVDVWVARSGEKFYDRYEAGLNRDLIAICQWLNAHHVDDGEVAISQRYINLGRNRISPFGLRAATMLTGKAIISVPRNIRPSETRSREIQRWFSLRNQRGIKYYLQQPEVSPWRVWHFRLGWLQKQKTGMEAVDTGAGWRLYEVKTSMDLTNRWIPVRLGSLEFCRQLSVRRIKVITFTRVSIDAAQPVTRVPGL